MSDAHLPEYVSERLAAVILGIGRGGVRLLLAKRVLRNEAEHAIDRRTMARITLASVQKRLGRPITAAEYHAARDRLIRSTEGRRIQPAA